MASRLLLALFAALSVAEEAIDPTASVPVAARDIADAEQFIREGARGSIAAGDFVSGGDDYSLRRRINVRSGADEEEEAEAEAAALTAAEIESARRALAREDEEDDEPPPPPPLPGKWPQKDPFKEGEIWREEIESRTIKDEM